MDMFVGADPIHRKARTREELEAVMKEPRGLSPTRERWIHETLVDDARRLWEQWTNIIITLSQDLVVMASAISTWLRASNIRGPIGALYP